MHGTTGMEERLRVPFADLRTQYHKLKQEIDDSIASVIESGCFIDGENVLRLEHEISELCGSKFGIGVASGTDALVLSLAACGIGAGDEVITTPFTFGATTEAIALVGAKAVFVDIDMCTYNQDASLIEDAITPNTKAILPVDLFGQMADRMALSAIAKKHNLRLIVDSAQAIGASQNREALAAAGDTTTLSFYPTKNLGAFGDAGMVLTNSEDLIMQLRSLHAHGTGRHGSYGFHERVGYCSRLDTIQSVVLLAKLPFLREMNDIRRRNAAHYNFLLAGCDAKLPRCKNGNFHIYHQYTMLHPKRDELQAFLKDHGVDTKIFYPLPMHLQPAYEYLGYKKGDFPNAEQVSREALSIPIYPELNEEQIEYVAGLILKFTC